MASRLLKVASMASLGWLALLLAWGGAMAKEAVPVAADPALEARLLRIPGWIFNSVLRELRDGYAVWTFKPVQ